MTRHSPDQKFVIVGANLAGAKAAETLRAEGFDGRLVMLGAGTERPYERPPLSKEYLRGEVGREKVYVHDEAFCVDNEIELLLGRTAVGIDPSIGEVALDDGRRIPYDRLLLATGAEPRRLSVAGEARRSRRRCAGMNVGVWDVSDEIQHLIRARVVVDDRRRADPDVPLRDLTPASDASAT